MRCGILVPCQKMSHFCFVCHFCVTGSSVLRQTGRCEQFPIETRHFMVGSSDDLILGCAESQAYYFFDIWNRQKNCVFVYDPILTHFRSHLTVSYIRFTLQCNIQEVSSTNIYLSRSHSRNSEHNIIYFNANKVSILSDSFLMHHYVNKN